MITVNRTLVLPVQSLPFKTHFRLFKCPALWYDVHVPGSPAICFSEVKTMEKLCRNVLTVSLLLGALFACIFPFARRRAAAQALADAQLPLVVAVDPGHGGEDGGATSVSGVLESGINLDIALRLRDLLALAGIEPLMIRTTDTAIYTGDCRTITQKKVSDLKNRVAMVNNAAPALLISIHQNFFEQSKYRGAQVFFSKTDGSRALAEMLQQTLREQLDPSNRRQVKPAQSVYLMEHAGCTAVLVECGFLSNPEEDRLLQTDAYQKKIAAAICGAVTQYLSEKEHTNEV